MRGSSSPWCLCTEVEDDLFDRLFDINVKGVFNCMKHEIPAMVKQGGGRIVNTSSTAGVLSIRNQGSYRATKYAVVALSKSTALEFAADKVLINALCPGITDTPMIERVSGGTEEGHARLRAQEPVGRYAKPQEMARTCLWLCSADSAFITGAALNMTVARAPVSAGASDRVGRTVVAAVLQR